MSEMESGCLINLFLLFFLTATLVDFLTVDEVVRSEKFSYPASSDAVHSPRLQVNEKGSGHILTS